jgi:hypothetical protein
VCDRQKEFALDRPNGRYRLNELSSTSTSQIKHGVKSLDSDPGILAGSRNRAELVDSLSCASKRRGLASGSRASGVGPKLSRHFRMSRPAGLNIIAGHAATFHDQSSASRCRRYIRRTPSSPTRKFLDRSVDRIIRID